MRLLITFILLIFLPFSFTVANASPHTSAKPKQHNAKKRITNNKHPRTVLSKNITQSRLKTSIPKNSLTALQKKKLNARAARLTSRDTRQAIVRNKLQKGRKTITLTRRQVEKALAIKKRHGRYRSGADQIATRRNAPLRMDPAHHARYQKARQTAMRKLMGQLGKPYIWGGASPKTGFDCSGLVWYAYKDLLKTRIPRTANEMFQFSDAAPIRKEKLERGDLVFFRINGRGAADHVGVYLGSGKFIQSPRTGKDIQISQLSDSYWQKHYVGARRVMTPKNIKIARAIH
ncbi:C40 family peptidase [Enterobacteriaceae bacterium LUAb1]